MLDSLTSTTKSLNENIVCAHLQAVIWRHPGDADPPRLNHVMYSWRKEDISLTLVILLPNVSQAPDELIKPIWCACDSDIAIALT